MDKEALKKVWLEVRRARLQAFLANWSEESFRALTVESKNLQQFHDLFIPYLDSFKSQG